MLDWQDAQLSCHKTLTMSLQDRPLKDGLQKTQQYVLSQLTILSTTEVQEDQPDTQTWRHIQAVWRMLTAPLKISIEL
jgi:hypothetical protein